jgi:tetratricopeptide (TPR) repeat protein
MRYPNASPTASSSWMHHKEQGRVYYVDGQYDEALASYRAALNPVLECPATEAQILRSNVVACRLKLGGVAQAAAAVQDAKQCIHLNPAWAKGHVRLASAYVALGGHSNDACNALQTAIRLDPNHQLARKMLLRELRRDHATADTATPSAPPEEQGDVDVDEGSHEEYTGGDAFRQQQQQQRQRQPQDEPPYQAPVDVDIDVDIDVDDSLSFRDRLQFYTVQIRSWYQAQNGHWKLAVRVLLVVLAMYVAFGGRFGSEYMFSKTPSRRGNYGAGNAYDQYRRKSYSTSNSNSNHFDYYGSSSSSSSNTHRPRKSSSWSFDRSLPSMILLAGGAYLAHRNGVNPMHILMLANMFAGGRGRRRGYRPMGGMGGWGGGGMRWGQGRRRW